MKWIEWAVVGVLILFPFAQINQLETELLRKTILLELRYDAALDAALDAAVDAAAQTLLLNANEQKESRYESVKRIAINKEAAIEAFYHTLYLNFGIAADPIAQGVLRRYVPAVAIVGYDGFYVYAEDEWIDSSGQTIIGAAWGLKKPYVYSDAAGNSFSFTLDEQILAYAIGTHSWHEGLRSEMPAHSYSTAERWEPI